MINSNNNIAHLKKPKVLLLFLMLYQIIVQAVKDLEQLMMKIIDLPQKKFYTIIKVIFKER
jgi:hypothetical protein